MFENITIQGGLFNSEELQRILDAGQGKKGSNEEGLRAADYDHIKKLEVVTNESFRGLETAWKGQFTVKRSDEEDAERVTWDSWLRFVFAELGFTGTHQSHGLRIGDSPYREIQHAWNGIPLHVVPHTQDLEERLKGASRNPHSTLQEYLTRSDVTWGVVTNGRQWRILRDNSTHTRPAYIEFNLEGIMEGESYEEFQLFWLMNHCTRFPDDPGWLETWMKNGQRQGTRAVEALRKCVSKAIEALGQGFIRNPKNVHLRAKLADGDLSAQDYFHELLRLVYRLIFLLVTEDRNLLLWKQDDQDDGEFQVARKVYEDHYSVGRLRTLSERIKGTKHRDLFETLKVVMAGLGGPEGLPQLGFPPLNSALWSAEFIPHLEDSSLENQYLLAAIKGLNKIETPQGKQRIDYANLGAEELGSVYEGLLEVNPVVDVAKNRFLVEDKGGSERRTTGSHYTPTDLIDKVLDHALDPLLDEAEEKGKTAEEKAKNLLELTVCDPTCGSGHFLIAAAHRIARRVAVHHYGETEPTPGHLRHALRDVISRCIYGVDINPMAVELCKVSLWLEAMEPGKPLAFLDHHIKCGNALLGAFPEYLERGIPDEAYKPRPGIDNPEVCKELKRINKLVPMNQETLKHFKEDRNRIQKILAEALEHIEAMPTDTVEQIEAKEEAYRTMYLETHEYERYKLALDAWCAAFSYPKVALGSEANIGNPELIDFLADEEIIAEKLLSAIFAERDLSTARFFHWEIEFPQAASRGGFQVVLGNPPYQGSTIATEENGEQFLEFISTINEGYQKKSNLSAAFIKTMLRVNHARGQVGVVTTNMVAKGVTRESLLAPFVKQGGAINMAANNMVWPGEAQVVVALLVLSKERRFASVELDGELVGRISSRLDALPEGDVVPLKTRKDMAFEGDKPGGMGFIIKPHQEASFVEADAASSQAIYDYLVAEDLYQNPAIGPSRRIICFGRMDLDEATEYKPLMNHVVAEVKPQREKVKAASWRKYWWRFANYREKLRAELKDARFVIVKGTVSECPLFIAQPPAVVFSNRVVVVARDSWTLAGELNSLIHEVWFRKQGSAHHERVTYTPKGCFQTFPVPKESPDVARLGEAFHETVLAHARTRGIALTPVWNLVNDPECHDADIEEIRRLRNELTVAVAEAFGMEGIDFRFGHYKDHADRWRYTMHPEAQEQVYLELVKLNLEQAEAEKSADSGNSRKERKLAKGQSKLEGMQQGRL